MAGWDNGVSAPGGASYTAPLLSFQGLGEIGDAYNRGNQSRQDLETGKQQQRLNEQRQAEGQRQAEIAQTFKNGLPVDPATGAIDYKKAVAMLAQKGDNSALWNGADAMAIQGAGNLSPMLSGGAQGQGAPAPAPAPTSSAPAGSPRGDAGSGTIASIVTDRLPGQDVTTGQTIAKVAQVMGVDPNANLTPGQQRRAQGLVQKYAPAAAAPAAAADAGTMPPSANAVQPAPPSASGSGGGGRLPLSQPQPVPVQPAQQPAAAAPPQGPQAPQQPAPIGAGSPAPQAQPQQSPQQQPLRPQVPLPKGFTDPQAAILALRTEAARLSNNPRARGQVDELKNWAERIEQSIQPVEMSAGRTMLDPKTGQPLYQGNQPTLSADAIHSAAERYLETGQLPPNTGRGVQGAATSSAIQNEAAQLAAQRGIDMATLPGKWQQFKAQQVGIQRFTSGPQGNTVRSFNVLVDHLDTLTEAAAAMKNGDMRLLNKWKNDFAAARGEPAPTNFDGVKALVGDEIVKAVVGSAGALADREEVKKDLDRASSPKQLFELIERYKKLALGQLKGLRKQYETATGQKNFGDMLLPGTLAALGGNEGKGSAPDKDGWVTLPNGARIQEIKEGK